MDIFSEPIRNQISGLFCSLKNPVYAFMEQYEKLEATKPHHALLGYDIEELTTTILFGLEKIRVIKQITPLHGTHISFILKETKKYISYLSTVIQKNNEEPITKHPHDFLFHKDRIYKTTCTGLLIMLILLEKTNHADFAEFSEVAKSLLPEDIFSDIDKSTIHKCAIKDDLQKFLKSYITPNEKKYSITLRGTLVNKDYSGIIEDIIEYSCIHQRISKDEFNHNPYVYWENLINSIKPTDDTAKLGNFLHRVADTSNMNSDIIKQRINAAITQKVDNVDTEIKLNFPTSHTTNNFFAPVGQVANNIEHQEIKK